MPTQLDNSGDSSPTLNRSVMFLKEPVVLSNEFWQIAIDVTLMRYEDALSVIKGELLEM
jgi:hypothetical protein